MAYKDPLKTAVAKWVRKQEGKPVLSLNDLRELQLIKGMYKLEEIDDPVQKAIRREAQEIFNAGEYSAQVLHA